MRVWLEKLGVIARYGGGRLTRLNPAMEGQDEDDEKLENGLTLR
jgi:hypothetical protein